MRIENVFLSRFIWFLVILVTATIIWCVQIMQPEEMVAPEHAKNCECRKHLGQAQWQNDRDIVESFPLWKKP